MEPAYHEGDFAFVRKETKNVHVGDVVVTWHPVTRLFLLKRIVKIQENLLWIEGDNKNYSQDSRDFGWIPRHLILGKAHGILRTIS